MPLLIALDHCGVPVYFRLKSRRIGLPKKPNFSLN
jgi:hypothetical protein